ncbi:unnamed protein product [Linum trigynum]|uniref:Uncharacterized protein n=1 Tax=Linum trigynum TaxID=586398 RepID=A0AAV2GA26_9ROSI
MVYRYPNREGGSLWHEEYLITTQDELDAMLEFLRSNNIFKAEIFVYTEAVEGVGGNSGDGQTSGTMVDVNYMVIIPTKVTMILIPTFSTKSKVKLVINLSHHMKKKFNDTMPTNPSTTSIQAATIFKTTITKLMKVPFMIWIRWKMPCQHQLVTPLMKKKKGAMLVQTVPTLLKVLMIQEAESQIQMMMRCLVTVYLFRTTLTFQTTIGVSIATWGRQRSQYGVHSLGL